jgi:hypothetical protein
MKNLRLASILVTLTELIACFIYFVVYYIESLVCQHETNYAHITEVILTLFVASFAVLAANVIHFIILCITLIRERTFEYQSRCYSHDECPYTKASICYNAFLVLCLIIQIGIFTGLSGAFLSIYVCHVRNWKWGYLCEIDPIIVFGYFGYYVTTCALVVYVLCLPCVISRLLGLCMRSEYL